MFLNLVLLIVLVAAMKRQPDERDLNSEPSKIPRNQDAAATEARDFPEYGEEPADLVNLLDEIKRFNILPATDAGSLLSFGMTCTMFQSMVQDVFTRKYGQDLVSLVEDIKECPRESPFYRMLRKSLVSIWPVSPNCVFNSKLRGGLLALQNHLDDVPKPAYRFIPSRPNLWGNKAVLSHVKGFEQVTEVLLKNHCYSRCNIDVDFMEDCDWSLLQDLHNEPIFSLDSFIAAGKLDAVDYLIKTLDVPMSMAKMLMEAQMASILQRMDYNEKAGEMIKRMAAQGKLNLINLVYSELPFKKLVDLCHPTAITSTVDWLLYLLNSGRAVDIIWLNDSRLFEIDDVKEEEELFNNFDREQKIAKGENVNEIYMIALVRHRPTGFLQQLVNSKHFKLDEKYFYLVDMLGRSSDLLDVMARKLKKGKYTLPRPPILGQCKLRNASLSMPVVAKLAEYGLCTYHPDMHCTEFLMKSMDYLLGNDSIYRKSYLEKLFEDLTQNYLHPTVLDKLISYDGGRLLMNSFVFKDGEESSNIADAFMDSKTLGELLQFSSELDELPDSGDFMTEDFMRNLRPFLLKAILKKNGGVSALRRLGYSRFLGENAVEPTA